MGQIGSANRVKLFCGIISADDNVTKQALGRLCEKFGKIDVQSAESDFNFTDYYKYLINDKTGQAAITFIDKVTTNHTYFMRETDHFDYFRDKVLPYIEETAPNNDLRLWCAGCSSGEESYTIKFIVEDYFRNKKPQWNTEILATDISTQVLDKAIHGVYPTDSVNTLPEVWRKKYFEKFDEGHSIVKKDIKSGITYRKFNLMNERFPFKKPFQVIFCRNVMIYFDTQTRDIKSTVRPGKAIVFLCWRTLPKK